MSQDISRDTAEEVRVGKEPWLAVHFSRCLPGLGQWYAGRPLRGVILFLLCGTAMVTGFFAFISPETGWMASSVLFLFAAGVALYACIDAHGCARRENSIEAEAHRKSAKDPYMAFFLSSQLPGLGHVYCRRWVLGFLILAGVLAASFFLEWYVIETSEHYSPFRSNLAYLSLAMGAAVLAFHLPPRAKCIPGSSLVLAVSATAISFVSFSVSAQCIRAYCVTPFKITGGSMEPALPKDCRILVRMTGPEHIRRGDIIAFRHHAEDGEIPVWSKRVVGLPGERVTITENGQIEINGKTLEGPPWDHLRYPDQPHSFEPGRRNFLLAHSEYWVLGDKSRTSLDSRSLGPVQSHDILGPATKIWWPPAAAGPIPRY